MLNEINEEYADFVLNYAKNDGLIKLVSSIKLDEINDNIVADLQYDLVVAFTDKFPDVDISELDTVVQWILLKAIIKQTESK